MSRKVSDGRWPGVALYNQEGAEWLRERRAARRDLSVQEGADLPGRHRVAWKASNSEEGVKQLRRGRQLHTRPRLAYGAAGWVNRAQWGEWGPMLDRQGAT